jgi:hypothetical protein
MFAERFAVEADRKVVGVAVRDRGGFRFFASDCAYKELDRAIFPRARTLANTVTRLSNQGRLPGRRAYQPSRRSVQ